MNSDWTTLIPVAWGQNGSGFTNHPCDIERAQKLLKTALEQGVTFGDYCKAIEQWLNIHHATKGQAFIDDQMKKVRDLTHYFKAD